MGHLSKFFLFALDAVSLRSFGVQCLPNINHLTFAGTGVDLSSLFRVVNILYARETLYDTDLESCVF